MVFYCSVNGCGNNSNKKKKDRNSYLSFHAFPSNQKLKQKWLLALGRPKWKPPAFTRICSVHFSDNQIVHNRVQTLIVENACPDRELPLNSCFEGSDLEMCRICLATDLLLYSIEDGELKFCMESIIGFNENLKTKCLPHFVCYECAALLKKCYRLVEKSVVAQTVLLDIHAENGKVTKSLVESQSRDKLNLTSPLSFSMKPTKLYEFKYDDHQSYSYHYETNSTEDCVLKEENMIDSDEDCFEETIELIKKESSCDSETKVENEMDETIENEVYETVDNEVDVTVKNEVYETDTFLSEYEDHASNSKTDADSIHSENINSASDSETSVQYENVEYLDEYIELENLKEAKVEIKETVRKKSEVTSKWIPLETQIVRRKRVNGLTPQEIRMQEFFDIKIIPTLEEQIAEWKKSITLKIDEKLKHKCEICTKPFVNIDSYLIHATKHDPNRGSLECPVCKIRFRTDLKARKHVDIRHTKKFQCKSCPNVLHSLTMAMKHHKWHTGHRYQCKHCPFSAAHASGLYQHLRLKHAPDDVVCALCGRTFATRHGLRQHQEQVHWGHQKTEGNPGLKCEDCQVHFENEAARRVHYLTAPQHKKTKRLDRTLSTACRSCGEQFGTRRELLAHALALHPTPQARTHPQLSTDHEQYPKKCEHCEETMEDRKQHWAHVRREHFKYRRSYQPFITCVCQTCGQGFQNKSRLRLHELRHGSPSVKCKLCPKVFYDKYCLENHMSAHDEARPYCCETCGSAFKFQSNLHRHRKIHSDATPYECPHCAKKFKYSTSLNLHVRCVHQKIPMPPKKRKTRAKDKT